MECQEFAYETVVDRGIIRSPAKRNRSPGGPGKCFLRFAGFFFAIFCPQLKLQMAYFAQESSGVRQNVKTGSTAGRAVSRSSFCRFFCFQIFSFYFFRALAL